MREQEWPEPSPDARAHSLRLVDAVRAEIDANGGAISFERYMDLVLYAPGLGYYAAGARKFGEAGDFVTAPELGPLFARCLARQCRQVFDELDGGDVLEPGAGSGVLAAELLRELERLGRLPGRYLILEVSPDLRARQQETLELRVPQLLERVHWIDVPPAAFRGVLIANEVLDALPVARFRVSAEGCEEQQVGWQDGHFTSAWKPAAAQLREELEQLRFGLPVMPAGYVSEYCRRLPALIREFARGFDAGVMLFIDYGYARREYYLPERAQGTLMCHYRHRAHADPFVYPGLQDITAFVDFTLLAEAGVNAGLELEGYTTQAQFLLGVGLDDALPRVEPGETLRSLKVSQEVQRLTMPGEMGDRFKVMGLGRGLDSPLDGFGLKDLSSTL